MEQPPEYQIELTYTPVIMRQAALAFVWRGMGGLALLGLIWLLVGAALSLSRPYGWLGGMWCGISAVLLMLVIGVYVTHYRRGMARLRRMKVPHAVISLSKTQFAASADSGSWSVPWTTFGALWRFRNFWLLVIGTSQYVTLPLAPLSEEVQSFITSRVAESGGRVR